MKAFRKHKSTLFISRLKKYAFIETFHTNMCPHSGVKWVYSTMPNSCQTWLNQADSNFPIAGDQRVKTQNFMYLSFTLTLKKNLKRVLPCVKKHPGNRGSGSPNYSKTVKFEAIWRDTDTHFQIHSGPSFPETEANLALASKMSNRVKTTRIQTNTQRSYTAQQWWKFSAKQINVLSTEILCRRLESTAAKSVLNPIW